MKRVTLKHTPLEILPQFFTLNKWLWTFISARFKKNVILMPVQCIYVSVNICTATTYLFIAALKIIGKKRSNKKNYTVFL